MSVASVKRSGKKLTATVTLTDQRTHKKVSAKVALQRKVGSVWKTVATVKTSKFSAKTTKATYRLFYAGTSTLAPSTSKSFKK